MDLLSFESLTASALRITATEKIQGSNILAAATHEPKKLKPIMKPWVNLLKAQDADADSDAVADMFGVTEM